jgi:exopolyphosphatase/guanosine-5'-triphosphate,3'-diphosphate pyrophosphatase
VGGDARFAAREVGRATESPDLNSILPGEFDSLVVKCVRYRPEELAKKYGLPYAEAETINPALLVYNNLWSHTKAEQMLVSQVSMRDGLLLELARDVTGEEDEALAEGVIHSAVAIAEKYRADLDHGRNVADLSVALFDTLQDEHGLGGRYRLLLRVAGLLHEIGGFVSNRAHHKHSYYLISNTEIFGLKRDEIEIVAHIARYHRRSGPKPSHIEYVALPRETRVVVNKLAALLRVADALARGHIRQIDDVRFELQGDELLLHVHGLADYMLEQRAIALKGDLFEDIYGIRIRFEEL